MKNFTDIFELSFLSKEELSNLANNKIVNLNDIKESIQNYDENKRTDRREFSDVVDIWINKGYGKEISCADLHQFQIQ